MKVAISACILLIAATSAQAAGRYFDFIWKGESYRLLMPDKSYLTAKPMCEPRILIVGQNAVRARCTLALGRTEKMGCWIYSDIECDILVNEDLPPRVQKMIIEHEKAHVHDWPADHPVK